MIQDTFIIPKTLLKMIHIWPMDEDRFKTSAFLIQLSLMVGFELGLLVFCTHHSADVAKLATVSAALSTTLQGIVKLCVIFAYTPQLKRILNLSLHEFWTINSQGVNLEMKLRRTRRNVTLAMCVVTSTGGIYSIIYHIQPLIYGTRMLPYESWYPFNWERSPIYECVYIVQMFVNMYMILWAILGHDFLFFVMCFNLAEQFRLLAHAGKCLRTQRDVVAVVDHHNMLINIFKQLEVIFALSCFVQLAASVSALCVSFFLISAGEIDLLQIYHLSTYCLGHLLQLFMFCTSGTEVAMHSVIVSTKVFGTPWYKNNTRKSLVMMIGGGQQELIFHTFGVFPLDYTTFVSVLRLAFSFYTLLGSIIERKGDGN